MLARLVAFPSVSTSSNLDIINFCRDWLNTHGVESTLVMSPEGDKANLYATIGPKVEGGIVFSGHTDVVPVEGQNWTTDPWTLTEKNGRLYGRGSADMKGFDALVLALVPEMAKMPLKRPVHIALSYDEEIACRGAPSMVEAIARSVPKPAAVIVGEPTRHAVVTGHKASVQLRTQVTGYAVHSSRIDQGVSAVMNAARLIAWHEDVMEENRRRADLSNPFEPPYTTLHCGMVAGGNAANVVSSSAWFFSDIRAIPTESLYPGGRRATDEGDPAGDRRRRRVDRGGAGAQARDRRGGRAPHAPAHRRQRHPCGVLWHRGRHLPEGGLVDSRLRAGRHRPGSSARRVYRDQRVGGR
jgi:acetylornithine deacetylase